MQIMSELERIGHPLPSVLNDQTLRDEMENAWRLQANEPKGPARSAASIGSGYATGQQTIQATPTFLDGFIERNQAEEETKEPAAPSRGGYSRLSPDSLVIVDWMNANGYELPEEISD